MEGKRVSKYEDTCRSEGEGEREMEEGKELVDRFISET